MLKLLRSLFRPKVKSNPSEAADPEAAIYSAIFNETTAQGFILGNRALDLAKDMLDTADQHATESPIFRAKRAYAGYQAIENKFVELLTDQMKEWIDAKFADAIRSLNIEQEVADLLRQAVEPSYQRFQQNGERLFRSRAADLKHAEVVGIFEERYDTMQFVTMPEWMLDKKRE